MKKASICFVANFFKTAVFHEVALRLEKQGIHVCWVVTKRDQHQFLAGHYKQDRLLYVNRSYINKPHEVVGDFRLNELVYGDRVFIHHLDNGLRFLENIQKPVFDFLKKNQVRFIIGEVTWAHELLLLRMAAQMKELNCMYLECSMVRIPNHRFAFFTDDHEYGMMEFDKADAGGKMIRIEKPSYAKLNDTIVKKSSSLQGKVGRFKRFLTGENIEKSDPNVITEAMTRLKVAGTEEINRMTYKYVKREDFENVRHSNYVFYGFHKQPESSVEVMGRYYEDQSQLIINLWRMLPHGWKLVLKEHTNAIGDRSYRFYKKLASFPGVVIVNEKTDSRMIIENSRLVASITGTICYEAALLGKPAITFANIYFNRINFCRHVSLTELAEIGIARMTEMLAGQPDNRSEFSDFLIKNSFEGYVTDFMTDPTVLEPENIDRITRAFLALADQHG
jgi:hypothetical protein